MLGSGLSTALTRGAGRTVAGRQASAFRAAGKKRAIQGREG